MRQKKHGSGLQNAAECESQESNSNDMSPYHRDLTTVQKTKKPVGLTGVDTKMVEDLKKK